MSLYIMYNTCYGGFSVSEAALEEYRRQCPEAQEVSCYSVERHDPVMVGIVQRMGERANGQCAKINLKEISAEYLGFYEIDAYDGMEHVIIQYDKFKLDCIKSLLKDKVLNKADKLARIAAVVNQEPDSEEW